MVEPGDAIFEDEDDDLDEEMSLAELVLAAKAKIDGPSGILKLLMHDPEDEGNDVQLLVAVGPGGLAVMEMVHHLIEVLRMSDGDAKLFARLISEMADQLGTPGLDPERN
jgi:hypothetical protein